MPEHTTYRHTIQPALEEVAGARPAKGQGAPSRTRSHYERILVLLRERGAAGVLSTELYDAPHLFGRSPRNRISEMRQDGCLIETKPAGASVVRYVLLRDANGQPPPQGTPPPHAKSSDWYAEEHGPRPAAHPWKKPFSEKRMADDFQLTPLEPRR